MSSFETYAAYNARIKAEWPAKRQQWYEGLRDIGCTSAHVEYSGSGDDGSVGYYLAYFGDNERARDLTAEEISVVGSDLDEICYEILERLHPGWEINDGSEGQLTIDLSKPVDEAFELHHGNRSISYETDYV